MSASVVVWLDGNVIGSVGQSNCENEACLVAIADGRPYHATPSSTFPGASFKPWPTYHFASWEEAIQAIEGERIPS